MWLLGFIPPSCEAKNSLPCFLHLNITVILPIIYSVAFAIKSKQVLSFPLLDWFSSNSCFLSQFANLNLSSFWCSLWPSSFFCITYPYKNWDLNSKNDSLPLWTMFPLSQPLQIHASASAACPIFCSSSLLTPTPQSHPSMSGFWIF